MKVIDRATWERRCRQPVLEENALWYMEQFCDESDGMAEFRLERTMGDDGEPLWFASIRWDGVHVDTEDRFALGDRTSPTTAVLHAVYRWLRSSNPEAEPLPPPPGENSRSEG